MIGAPNLLAKNLEYHHILQITYFPYQTITNEGKGIKPKNRVTIS